MGFVKKLVSLVYNQNFIVYSKITSMFTKYGKFDFQAYRDGQQEYLVIKHQNFSGLKNSIVYVHSEIHECNPFSHDMCYCNNQMNMALKMIHESGGVVIFYSQNAHDIDGFLQEINARKLGVKKNVMTKAKINVSIKMKERKYHTLAFILENLKLSAIKLVTNDVKVIDITQQLGIQISKRVSSISFEYG
jgi:GTP cyclohydrolase II